MPETPPAFDFKNWLKKNSQPDDRLQLSQAQAKAVFQELQSLRQSCDRLRKQNKKLRRRAGTEETVEMEEGDSTGKASTEPAES